MKPISFVEWAAYHKIKPEGDEVVRQLVEDFLNDKKLIRCRRCKMVIEPIESALPFQPDKCPECHARL